MYIMYKDNQSNLLLGWVVSTRRGPFQWFKWMDCLYSDNHRGCYDKSFVKYFLFQLFVSSDTMICDSDRIQAGSFDCKSFIPLFLFISFNLISPNWGKFSHIINHYRDLKTPAAILCNICICNTKYFLNISVITYIALLKTSWIHFLVGRISISAVKGSVCVNVFAQWWLHWCHHLRNIYYKEEIWGK